MRILFLSAVNSARSQMAEGLAKTVLGENSSVQSAGANPSLVHPLAVEAMKEISIDISSQTSKGIDEIDPRQVDTVIYLSPEAQCPAFLGTATHFNWKIPDPVASTGSHEEQLQRFREAREMIRTNLKKLTRQARQAPVTS